MKSVGLAACVVTFATLLVSSCASGTATVTGTLVGADGGCLYVDVPAANGSDRYWLRHLPPDYRTDDDGRVVKPDGAHIGIGDSVTVSGALAWVPFERQCAGARTLDATEIR